jgi:hypothetical protein
VTVRRRSRSFAVLLAALGLFAGAAAGAEARIAFYGSTGLSLDSLAGYLGEQDRQERIVVETDEAPVHLLFLWDSTDLDPWVTVTDAAGRTVGTYSLAPSNRITLSSPGRYVMMLSARSGAGHWLCVLLSGRQWDTRP